MSKRFFLDGEEICERPPASKNGRPWGLPLLWCADLGGGNFAVYLPGLAGAEAGAGLAPCSTECVPEAVRT
jgi:hypothetical protein